MSKTMHVIPVNDQIEHEESDECACVPAQEPVEREDGSVGWVVVHHAWDGRPQVDGPAPKHLIKREGH